MPSSGRPASVPSSGKPVLESFDGRILQAQAHLFEPEKQLAVGAGRDYEAEMRQLEARADALTAEAERIDLTQALRECTNNVARATEVARGCSASNGERALAKIRDQQERFRALAAAQGVDLEQDRATLGLEPSDRGARATAEPTALNKYAHVSSGAAARRLGSQSDPVLHQQHPGAPASPPTTPVPGLPPAALRALARNGSVAPCQQRLAPLPAVAGAGRRGRSSAAARERSVGLPMPTCHQPTQAPGAAASGERMAALRARATTRAEA